MKEDLETIVGFIGHRYGTFDPFAIAEHLNIQVEWKAFGPRPIGETKYYPTMNGGKAPIVLLNDKIRDSVQRYFAMAHELGHVLEHEGLEGYYDFNRRNRSKVEVEADAFASCLLIKLFVEENGRSASDYQELMSTYGFPDMEF